MLATKAVSFEVLLLSANQTGNGILPGTVDYISVLSFPSFCENHHITTYLNRAKVHTKIRFLN